MSNTIKFWLILLLFLGLSGIAYAPHYNDLPSGVHAWGQADRYAIAKRYPQTGMNLVSISTYNMASENGRTGAELPLFQYAAASLSQIGLHDFLPFLIRLSYYLFFAFSLFVFLREFAGKQHGYVYLLSFIFLAAPVVAFYAYNFLPDIAGLGFILICYVFWIKYQKSGHLKWVFLCLLIGTLGSLIKLSVGIYLMANWLYFMLDLWLKQERRKSLLTLGIGFLSWFIILAYVQLAMIKVNEQYWSVVFRSHSNPIQSLTDLMDVIKGMAYWRTEYLSIPGYILFFTALVAAIRKMVRKKVRFRPEGLLFHSMIVLVGLFIFTLVLGKQFIHHDYYFIATYTPLIVVLCTWFVRYGLSGIKIPRLAYILSWGILLGWSVYLIPNAFQTRIQDSYKMRKHTIQNNAGWCVGGAEVLNNKNVDHEALIFVLYHESPNIPLIHFDRKGMCFNHEEITRKEPFIEHWLKKLDPGYLISENQWSSSFTEHRPDLIPNLEPFEVTDRYTIWKSKAPWSSFLSE